MSSVLIYHPLGLGDHIACSAIVREYSKTHSRVGLFCSPQNEPSVAFLYRDLPNVYIHLLRSHKEIKWLRIRNFFNRGKGHWDRIQHIGSFDPESGVKYERQFYQSAGIALDKMWDSFYVARDSAQEQALAQKLAPAGSYIFIHEDARFPLDTLKINSSLPAVRPDLALTRNIFDYCLLLQNAAEIHVMDSSFMFLVDCLAYTNPTQKLFVHRYARENLAWNLPILKKDWQIIL